MKTGILKLREHVDKRQGKIKAKGKQSYPLLMMLSNVRTESNIIGPTLHLPTS